MRGGIRVPHDSVKLLLSHSQNEEPEAFAAPQKPSQGAAADDLLARRKRKYAEELKAQIREKEAARLATQESELPRAKRAGLKPSASLPTATAAKLLNEADPNVDDRYFEGGDVGESMPVEGGAESLHSPPQQPSVAAALTEKERFIASKEVGVATKNDTARRNVTLPIAAEPPSRNEEEAVAALQRQQAFKEDLKRQIEEKKRSKEEEAEKERQWERDLEAQLEKEREQLRRDFHRDQDARRAKVAAKEAAGEAEEVPGVQIFVKPPRKPVPAVKSAAKETPDSSPERESQPTAQKKGAAAAARAAKAAAASPAVGRRSLPAASAAIAGSPAVGGPGRVMNSPRPSASESVEKRQMLPTADVAVATQNSTAAAEKEDPGVHAALVAQVTELLRLQEGLRSMQMEVVELVKEAKQATPRKGTTAEDPGATPLGSSRAMRVSASIPILYTSAQLRLEDSRPTTRQRRPSASAERRSFASRSAIAAAVQRPAAKAEAALPILREEGSQWAVGSIAEEQPAQEPPPPQRSTEITTAAAPMWSPATVDDAAQPVSAALNANTTLLSTPVRVRHAAHKLSLWKRAKRTFSGLSAAKRSGREETAWLVQEHSTATRWD